MRATLRAEVDLFLRTHGPATANRVALGVRARRADVDRVLAGAGFERTHRPEGGSPRAAYFGVSERVPRRRSGKTQRSTRMLHVLRDGAQHTRSELVASGVGAYTNNAAAELRAQGFDVQTRRVDGEVVYWIAATPAAAAGAAA